MDAASPRSSAGNVRRVLLLSAAGTLAVMIFKARTDHCWFRYVTADDMALEALIVFVFSLFWFRGSPRSRIVLVIVVAVMVKSWSVNDRFFMFHPSDPEGGLRIEESMASSLRGFQRSVMQDKAAHPEASYETLIQNREMTAFYPYCTRTTLSRASAVGPVTGFVMFATPDPDQCSLTSTIDLPRPATSDKIIREIGVTRECGPRRSFAISTDGKLHSTVEQREATLNDPAM